MSKSTSSNIYVIGAATKLLLSFLNKQNLDLPEVRQQLQKYEHSPHIPISLWWTLLDKIHDAYPVDGLGLLIGQGVEVHHLGVLGYLLQCCDTVEQALSRLNQFQALVHNLVPSYIVSDDKTWSFCYDAGQIRSTMLSDEVLFSSMISAFRMWFNDPTIAPLRIEFKLSAPKDTIPFTQFFACPVHFNSKRSAITFSIDQVKQPIQSKDPVLLNILEQQAKSLLQKSSSQHDDWLSELQKNIMACIQNGCPTFADAARCMGLSERTLYRQLQKRGLHFKQLLNRLRFELAKNYLDNDHLSLAEVSLLLGFAEQSVFSRVFKQWSGLTPLQFRKQVKSDN